jgi:hypothetical protein
VHACTPRLLHSPRTPAAPATCSPRRRPPRTAAAAPAAPGAPTRGRHVAPPRALVRGSARARSAAARSRRSTASVVLLQCCLVEGKHPNARAARLAAMDRSRTPHRPTTPVRTRAAAPQRAFSSGTGSGCCVAPSPPSSSRDSAPTSAPTGAGTVDIKEELSSLRLSALERRARAEGLSEQKIIEATDDDEDHPRAALIARIVEAVARARTTPPAGAELRLRAELGKLKLSALAARAEAAGAGVERIEGAKDSDSPRQGLIELIVEVERASEAREAAAAAARVQQAEAQLRGELSGLKLSQLARRAAEGAAATPESIVAAKDSDTPKQSLIELIVRRLSTRQQPSSPPAGEVQAQVVALRAELAGLRLSALEKRAQTDGVDTESITEALDSDDPCAALVALVIDRLMHAAPNTGAVVVGGGAAAAAAATADGAAREERELREVLQPLRLGALRARADGLGVTPGQLDTALDADDPKAALIQLLVQTAERSAAGARRRRRVEASLRADQLEGLGLGALQRRACEEGVPPAQLELALDSETPRQSLVRLLVGRQSHSSPTAGSAVQALAEEDEDEAEEERVRRRRQAAAERQRGRRRQQLHAELAQLRLGALQRRWQRRASAGSADAGLLEAILDDADDPSESLRELILASEMAAAPPTETAGSQDGGAAAAVLAPVPIPAPAPATAPLPTKPSNQRPHIGTADLRRNARPVKLSPLMPEPLLPTGKWCMISYSWSIQADVIRARKQLQARGVETWMDMCAQYRSFSFCATVSMAINLTQRFLCIVMVGWAPISMIAWRRAYRVLAWWSA